MSVDVDRIAPLAGQVLRYGAVGLSLNAALYLVYLTLTAIGLTPVVASTMAFAMGVPLSLAAHGKLTFRVPSVSAARKALFVVVYIAGYGVQIGVLVGLYRGLVLPHQLSQFIAILTAAAFLFVVQRRFVFVR